MPFIPHTNAEIAAMLAAIGVNNIAELFAEIPAELKENVDLTALPPAINEWQINRLMLNRAQQDGMPLNFIGAGAYEHHIPAAVWQIASRGEFYSAYTPYQAEASQGTLQLLYEYQSMMTGLTGMDVSNASLYDGASALAEAILMAVRSNRHSKSKRILLPQTVNPAYRACCKTLVSNQDIELITIPMDNASGTISQSALDEYTDTDITAVVIQQPNFFGGLEAVDTLTDWAQAQNALVIAVANPLTLAVLKPPGEWGKHGADIACGDGQPLGVPLSSGGPYFGYLCCRQEYVRQMPGRIIGRTKDLDDQDGYVLTLQAREQHIRRAKATSNICTNQGLVVTAATIHMAIMGPVGLQQAATVSYGNTQTLLEQLTTLPGVTKRFTAPCFYEAVIALPQNAENILAKLAEHNILGGYALCNDFPELQNCILICATETKIQQDLDYYVAGLANILRQ